ncbi:hypothetical protein ACIBG8_08570 [Nonomuraea sp. NPDC050556]|uniref:hypothetical protein n=1 Tax=Nonomuraea sp. NPDC050556 TaxID=3364369 RepID=UPI0037A55C48
MSPTDPAWRLVRATVFATVCIAASAGGHILAGGALASPGLLLLAAAGALALAYVIGGRPHSRGPVLGASVATQALLHELFSNGVPVAVGSAGHDHPGISMLTAHLTVAVMTGWWLHRGDSALWLLLHLLRRPSLPVLLRLTRIPSAGTPSPLPAAEPRVTLSYELVAAVTRRGPPIAALRG